MPAPDLYFSQIEHPASSLNRVARQRCVKTLNNSLPNGSIIARSAGMSDQMGNWKFAEDQIIRQQLHAEGANAGFRKMGAVPILIN